MSDTDRPQAFTRDDEVALLAVGVAVAASALGATSRKRWAFLPVAVIVASTSVIVAHYHSAVSSFDDLARMRRP